MKDLKPLADGAMLLPLVHIKYELEFPVCDEMGQDGSINPFIPIKGEKFLITKDDYNQVIPNEEFAISIEGQNYKANFKNK